MPCTTTSIAAASCSAVDCSATTAPKSSLLDSLANVRKQPMRQRTLLVVRVGQRARIGGGTDGSARIGSAILYGVRAGTAWNLKPMGHCSIANGSAATAWPGLARTHAHDPTSTQAQAHTHARTRTHTQDKGAGLSDGGGSARAHTPRRAKHSDCPVATNATNAALAPNQSAEVVDELDEPLPRLPCDAWSTPTRPRKGSPRRWLVASQ